MTFLMHLMLFCVESKTCYLPSAIIRSSITPMGNGAPDDYLLMGLMGPCNHFFFHLKPYSCRESVFYFEKKVIFGKNKTFWKVKKIHILQRPLYKRCSVLQSDQFCHSSQPCYSLILPVFPAFFCIRQL